MFQQDCFVRRHSHPLMSEHSVRLANVRRGEASVATLTTVPLQYGTLGAVQAHSLDQATLEDSGQPETYIINNKAKGTTLFEEVADKASLCV